MKRAVAIALMALAAATSSPAGAGTTGDPARGEAIYARCLACHALAYNRTGPKHCGLFGRRAGSVAGFTYSPAMARAGIVWDGSTLDRFLTNPTAMIPGTAMGYAGIADAQERADLIAWLRKASASPAECPP
ncbi:MAG: cytochrome c family protein [Proteobacteria bacterium]|nr:cytochrome c family protein [Pseudomonadota bacterium]